MRNFLCLFILFFFFSCSQNPVEKAAEAIDVALTHLSNNECDKALKILEDAGNQPDNGLYLQVKASAHACKAGFEQMAYVSTDLANNLDTTNGQTLFRSLAALAISDESEADSLPYTSIRTAIGILINSTADSPSQADRTVKFGVRRSGDMGVQALLLNLVNFGKFLNYYGNTDATGAKGAGPSGSTCFINYSDVRAQTIVTGGTTGACTSSNDGHPDMDPSTATGQRRLCEGLVLLTNTLDILDNLDFSGSPSFSKLEDVSTQVESFRTVAVAAGLGTLINMTSQSECEEYLTVSSQLLDMEYFYALVFEGALL